MAEHGQEVAIVTGAGSGIGAAVAVKPASSGVSMALLDVLADGLARTESQLAGGAPVLGRSRLCHGQHCVIDGGATARTTRG